MLVQTKLSNSVFYLSARAKDLHFVGGDEVKKVPELWDQCILVCGQVWDAVLKCLAEKHIDMKPDEQASVLVSWSIFAGIGATVLWHNDCAELKRKGIFNSLTEKGGVFALDNYVTDLVIGRENSTETSEGQDFYSHVKIMSEIALSHAANFLKEHSKLDWQSFKEALRIECQSGFFYGINWAMWNVVEQ